MPSNKDFDLNQFTDEWLAKLEWPEPGKYGSFEVIRKTLPRWGSLSMMSGPDFMAHRAIDFTVLQRHGTIWMSNSPMELLSNLQLAEKAQGDVLIGGLGIGMVLQMCLLRDEVESVTVVEINPHLPELLPKKVREHPKLVAIDIDDIEDILHICEPIFDTIILDVWDKADYENLGYMNKLKKLSLKCLRPHRRRYATAIRLWGYQHAVNKYVKECIDMVNSSLRFLKLSQLVEKAPGFHRRWPVLGKFLDWYIEDHIPSHKRPQNEIMRKKAREIAKTIDDVPLRHKHHNLYA
jgi:hypothetical protein